MHDTKRATRTTPPLLTRALHRHAYGDMVGSNGGTTHARAELISHQSVFARQLDSLMQIVALTVKDDVEPGRWSITQAKQAG